LKVYHTAGLNNSPETGFKYANALFGLGRSVESSDFGRIMKLPFPGKAADE
jgi:hypothetical protein